MKFTAPIALLLFACCTTVEPSTRSGTGEVRVENPGQIPAEFLAEYLAGSPEIKSTKWEGKPAALLFGEPIGSDGEILPALIEQYIARHDIYITKAEVDVLLAFMVDTSDSLGGDAANDVRFIAERFVLNFKASKALFEHYGGIVIFQQANPTEPVGAYLALLKEREMAGDFEFLDEDVAKKFWVYFEDESIHSVIRPENVDFSSPWWTRSTKNDE